MIENGNVNALVKPGIVCPLMIKGGEDGVVQETKTLAPGLAKLGEGKTSPPVRLLPPYCHCPHEIDVGLIETFGPGQNGPR